MALQRGRDPTSQDPGGERALRCHRGPTEGRSCPHLAAAARAQDASLRAPAASGPLTGCVPKCGRDVGTPVCVSPCRGTHDPGTGTQFRTRGRGAESLTDLGHLPAPHPPAPWIRITRNPSSQLNPWDPTSQQAPPSPSRKSPAEPGRIGSTCRAFPRLRAVQSTRDVTSELRCAECPAPTGLQRLGMENRI